MRQRVYAAVAFACLLAGCGSGGGGGGDSQPPQVTIARVDPGYMDATGGQANVRAEVSDASGLAWVRATVTRPDGSTQFLEMVQRPEGYWEGGFTAGYNSAASDQIYSVTVSAADRNGNVTSPFAASSLRVGGDVGPPPPPPL